MDTIITDEQIKQKIDNKTKPLGALGFLENIAFKICKIQNTLSPKLNNPNIFVFAGDHGIANEGVCAYPQEVTYQMVMNFLAGGAAINVFARQNNIALKIVDTGVNHNFDGIAGLIDNKVAMGTKSFLREKAMTTEQCNKAIENGRALVDKVFDEGCNVIGFGEMGISNTSSASILMHKFTGIALEECTGRGAGLSDEALNKKIDVLKQAVAKHPIGNNPVDVLATFGGFEIATMVGSILQAAEKEMIILVDGFIATAAFLTALNINRKVYNYSFFCHQSDEKGHSKIFEFFKDRTILNLGMRLGEGTGCAIAYPILLSAVNFINQMASFEDAGVSKEKIMKFIKDEIRNFLTAVMFYTRIPVPANLEYKPEYLNYSTKYFPIIGWIVGGFAAGLFYGANYVFPASISICISMIGSVLLTGAFHEDGFADFCDGFGGGWTRDKILEIMKDSRIGTYGAVSLIMILLFKFLLLTNVDVPTLPILLVFAHSLSRLMAVSFVYTHVYARADETSKVKPIAKGISHLSMLIAFITGFLPILLFNNYLMLFSILPLLIAKVILGRYFNKWLGGFTGDCLGAAQQISEIIIYLTYIAIWKFI